MGVGSWEVRDYHHLQLNVSVSSYHCLPSPFSLLLLCLRATNKLWMLIRKGQYSASQINSVARDIKETQTKSADMRGGRVEVTGEPVAEQINLEPSLSRSPTLRPCNRSQGEGSVWVFYIRGNTTKMESKKALAKVLMRERLVITFAVFDSDAAFFMGGANCITSRSVNSSILLSQDFLSGKITITHSLGRFWHTSLNVH